MILAKVKKAKEVSRIETAYLVRFVRRNYGLKLKIERERFYLSRRFLKTINSAKLNVSKDETIGACLYFAKHYAKQNKLGIFRKVK